MIIIFDRENVLKPLKEILQKLRSEGKLLVALLYGSYAKGTPHRRSDIDFAVFIRARDEKEDIEMIDSILMSTEKEVSLLRLDDEGESPFVVHEALKGIHLVAPDNDVFYDVAHRALRETEEM